MSDHSAIVWAACRRDSILLAALAAGVGAWAWTQGVSEMLAGGVLCALLYVAAAAVVRQGQRQSADMPVGRGAMIVWLTPLLLIGGVTLALVSVALQESLQQPLLAYGAPALILAWQIWFYLWLGE